MERYQVYLAVPPELATRTMQESLLLGLALLAATFMLHRLGRRLRPVLRGLATALLVIGFFASWEAGSRLCGAGGPYLPDPVLGWVPDPGTIRNLNHVLFENDAPQTPDRQWTIHFYGDSQLLEIHDRPDLQPRPSDTYPAVMSRSLQADSGTTPVRVVNAGVPGYSSWQALMLLRRHAPERRPDLVVLAAGWNDPLHVSVPDREVLSDDPRQSRLQRALYQSRIYVVLKRVIRGSGREADGRTVFARVSPDEYELNLREAARTVREWGGEVAIMLEPMRKDHPREVARTEPYRERARRVAAELGCPLLDLFTSSMALTPEQQAAFFPDDPIHLSLGGHRRVGEEVAALLRPMVPRKAVGLR